MGSSSAWGGARAEGNSERWQSLLVAEPVEAAGAGLVPQRLGQGLQCSVLLLGEPREALEFGEVHLTCFAAFAGGR